MAGSLSPMKHCIMLSLCLLVIISDTDCLVYHILSSLLDSCPTQPCLTLPQFTSDTSSHLHTNTTLLFQPGIHILDSNLTTETVLSLQLLKAFLPLNATIVCRYSTLYMYNITSVHISNLAFVGCSVKGDSIAHFDIEDTFFSGQENSSTALELINSSAVIHNSSFVSNVVGNLKRVELLRAEYHTFATVHVGGAVILNQSEGMFIGSIFKENQAEIGGAIFCEIDSNITIINCVFEQNYASIHSHSDSNKCYGGALYCQDGCYLIVENSTFDSNAAFELIKSTRNANVYSGGAIAVVHHARLDVNGCTFHNNEATLNGGAIYIWKSMVSVGNSQFIYNIAGYNGGAIYLEGDISREAAGESATTVQRSQVCVMTITSSQFSSNEASADGGAINTIQCVIHIIWSDFNDNVAERNGGAFAASSTMITFIESTFWYNLAEDGGASYTSFSSVNITYSCFIGNEADRGGALSCWQSTTLNVNMSRFDDNGAGTAGAIYISLGFMNIQESVFTHNNAEDDGGVIDSFSTPINIQGSKFLFNEAINSGGAIRTYNGRYGKEFVTVQIKECTFNYNKAVDGAALFVRIVTLNVIDCDFMENTAETGIMYISESNVNLSGNVKLANNIGSLYSFNCKLNVTHSGTISFLNNSSPIETTLYQQGGAITSFQSQMSLYGTCTLIYNSAENGGAILATESKMFVYGELLIANNTAIKNGGGIYLYQSEFISKDYSTITLLSNAANSIGGGIHSISSLIKVDHPASSVHFITNQALAGGGISLEMNARLYILVITWPQTVHNKYAVMFSSNSANYGGAVYVSDETNSGTCDSSYEMYSTLTECFMQTLPLYTEAMNPKSAIYFTQNNADISGSTLFGGLLDRCTASPFAEVHRTSATVMHGITYLRAISTFSDTSDSSTFPVSSNPVRVCFCLDDKPDFVSQSFHVKVEKGRLFKVRLVAIDHMNHTVNATVDVALSSNVGGLGEDQSLQKTTESCSDIILSVFSPSEQEQLILYAKGPCKDAELSIGRLFVHFLPCTCPIGFQPKSTIAAMETRCTCDCDPKLCKYITECDEVNETLAREGTFWIAYLNASANSSDFEYLIHAHCPLNYCHPPTTKVYINLNAEHGSDEQCAYNRSGTLCGNCKHGFSISLGSSHCIQCLIHWPTICLIIVLAALLAGIVLVGLLLALNLTVAMGTINGTIFYANIVNANSSTLLPFTEANYVTIFIAWINLELGIDTCFFEGMDMYWKTLLQLVFPMYVIFLVVMVIVISEYSPNFARLIGRKNPVATLDTLILFSYSKLLHTIIGALSFTILEYPDGSHEVVWFPDANIKYAKGKHAVLLFVAFAILIIGVAYTILLMSWQWLMQHHHKPIFKWISYHRLHHFIEPYHAPYVFKHRYWTGLLLLVRIVVHVATALNVSGAPAENLLVTGLTVFCLFLLKSILYGPIYQSLLVEFLETICYVNIIIFSFASFYALETRNGRNVVAYISGTITIVLFLAVIVYHMFTELVFKIKCCNKWKKRDHTTNNDVVLLFNYQQAESNPHHPPVPTVTWIDAPGCEQPHTDSPEDEVESNKETPLLFNDRSKRL